MNFEEIVLNDFTIVGISVETINADGKAQQDITVLWQRFLSESILQQIPNKVSEDIYCVYTNYESDYKGKYTTILGCKVASVDTSSHIFVVKEIIGGKYYKFISEGPIPESVGRTWSNIWETDYPRRYSADFDIYGAKSQDLISPQTETYLSIK